MSKTNSSISQDYLQINHKNKEDKLTNEDLSCVDVKSPERSVMSNWKNQNDKLNTLSNGISNALKTVNKRLEQRLHSPMATTQGVINLTPSHVYEESLKTPILRPKPIPNINYNTQSTFNRDMIGVRPLFKNTCEVGMYSYVDSLPI